MKNILKKKRIGKPIERPPSAYPVSSNHRCSSPVYLCCGLYFSDTILFLIDLSMVLCIWFVDV